MLETKKAPKNDYLKIRVAEAEKQYIKEAAAKKGVSMSDLVKLALLEYLENNKEVRI